MIPTENDLAMQTLALRQLGIDTRPAFKTCDACRMPNSCGGVRSCALHHAHESANAALADKLTRRTTREEKIVRPGVYEVPALPSDVELLRQALEALEDLDDHLARIEDSDRQYGALSDALRLRLGLS